MVQCPKCSAENSDDSRFCKSCGQEISSLSQAPTVAAPEVEAPPAPINSPHVGRIISSDSVPAGGFTPGTILADRYRIIGLLGRGGMGEVYRADDLKLGQPVALKFLPPALAEDSVRRERFFAEVRITRQLSHPNICRVYDIGEVDGRHFLSMEYIDGEDLASLMKRIGSLTSEKALDIARQLAAGLSVAHERGVLHRDLKPANIMLDGHGRVRITDFGLAIAVEDESQAEEIAGTPAYMAPEQLAGKGATVRSDIYSLGLILYEIYTGKKAFKARTLAELREQKETQTPRAPSELREGIDPVVERVIQRCMEKDPGSRPASLAQLAQALPGGDPLAAAIAAGETPSPEMVAESGGREGLRPAIAWGLLAFIILGTIAIMAMNDRVMLHRRIAFNKPPEVMLDRSREIIKKLGYSEEYADCDYGYARHEAYLKYIENSYKTSDWWEHLDSWALLFRYRQSPRLLEPRNQFRIPLPMGYSGEVSVNLDTEGNLVGFYAVPPQKPEPIQGSEPEGEWWSDLFIEAGLDESQWDEVTPEWTPFTYADTRMAWEGSFPDSPDIDRRIEAAAFQGKPVLFYLIGPWSRPTAMEPVRQTTRERIEATLNIWFSIPMIAVAIFFALRNMRRGRGDRRNANRLALLIVLLFFFMRILTVNHHLTSFEFDLILASIGLSLVIGGIFWFLYMAIEPFVRRQWPQALVSWTRLISGRGRDPHIARDILVGCAFGILILQIFHFTNYYILPMFGYAELQRPIEFEFQNLLGTISFIGGLMGTFYKSIATCMGLGCLFFFLKMILRSQRIAIAVVIIFFPLILGRVANITSIPSLIFMTALFLFVLIRFGLVAISFCCFTAFLFLGFPITLEAAWHAETGYFALVLFSAIILFAFYTSLGGRPIFGTPRLDD